MRCALPCSSCSDADRALTNAPSCYFDGQAIEEVLSQPDFGRMHYVLEGRLEGKPSIHASFRPLLSLSASLAPLTFSSSFSSFSSSSAHLEPVPLLPRRGHGGIGGEMNNVFSSPGDPLFYVHHANLDRIWRAWQARDLPGRLFEVDGCVSALFSLPLTDGWLTLNSSSGF